jgi:glycine cleavage system H protein
MESLHMNVEFKNFLGKDITIPDDRMYDRAEGLWVVKDQDGSFTLGLTEPALLMCGTVRQIDALVEDGTLVTAGETVLLALTAKLKYIATPVSGVISFPDDIEEIVAAAVKDPYGTRLFSVKPDDATEPSLLNAQEFALALKDYDGSKNPGGHKGGVSPTCKAVYMGLAAQKIID